MNSSSDLEMLIEDSFALSSIFTLVWLKHWERMFLATVEMAYGV